MSPTRRFFGFALRGGAIAAVGVLAALSSGCATTTPPTAREKPRVAAVVVKNSTPHRWRVTFSDAMGTDTVVIHVAPRGVDEVSFSRSGEFYVEQMVETGGADRPKPRTFSTRFVVGQRYHWTLATLLTANGTERIGL